MKTQLENDLALELDAVPRLNEAIKVATHVGDNGSRELFKQILLDEEHHIDYLEGQLHIVEEIGHGQLPGAANSSGRQSLIQARLL